MTKLLIQIAGERILAEIEDGNFADGFSGVIKCSRAEKERITRRIYIQGDEKSGYSVLTAPENIRYRYTTGAELADGVFSYLGTVILRSVKGKEYIIHASGTLLNNKVLLFSGVSGSGKTTFALEISKYGYYLGDEYTHVNTATGEVWFENYPFHLKDGNPYLMNFSSCPKLRTSDRYGQRKGFYISPDTGEIPQASIKSDDGIAVKRPLSMIVFPHFSASAPKTEIRKLSSMKLPELLLKGLFGRDAPSGIFKNFIKMLSQRNIKLVEIEYSDISEAAEKLYQYCEVIKTERQ